MESQMPDYSEELMQIRTGMLICREYQHESGLVQILVAIQKTINKCEEESKSRFGCVLQSPPLQSLYQLRQEALACLNTLRESA